MTVCKKKVFQTIFWNILNTLVQVFFVDYLCQKCFSLAIIKRLLVGEKNKHLKRQKNFDQIYSKNRRKNENKLVSRTYD